MSELKDGHRLVLIEWEDSHGVSSDWCYLDSCNPYVLLCRSVGWLIHDGEDCKVVVPHMTAPGEARRQGCGDMTIPTSAVRSVVTLKPDPPPRSAGRPPERK